MIGDGFGTSVYATFYHTDGHTNRGIHRVRIVVRCT